MTEFQIQPFKVKSNKPRSPKSEVASYLMEGAKMLATVCEMVDEQEGLTIPAALKANFDFASLQHKDGVVRAVDFKEATEGFIERCKDVTERIRAERKRAEEVLVEFRALAKEAIEQNQGIPFKGFAGSVAVQNGQGTLAGCGFTIDAPITKDMITLMGISPEYVKTTYTLDTAKIKADIKAGKDLRWAYIERGTHVVFRKARA